MGRKFLTLMVIPHNEDHIRELNISRPILWGVAAFFAVSIMAFGLFAYGYYAHLGEEHELIVLTTENEELETNLSRLRKSLGDLRHQIDDLTETDRQMRAYTSLTEPGAEVRKMGVGGFTDDAAPWDGKIDDRRSRLLEETYTDLDQLIREARFLQTSFDSVMSILAQDETIRNHTPSIFPVQGEGWPSSGFGYRIDPFTGQRTFHNGIDIAGRRGTAIVATADGIVDNVDYDKRLGNWVSIKHKGGLRTVYAHLTSKRAVKKGQQVARGETVGFMGNSGRTTATHLHYSVIHNRRALPPTDYIFDRRNRSALF